MRVIILYASAGAGHVQAAIAINEYFKKYHPQTSCQLCDILDQTNIFFRFSYRYGYAFLVHHALFLWRLFFLVTGNKFLRGISRRIGRVLNRINSLKFMALLKIKNPDWIICTHFLPAEICAELKSVGKITSRVFTVVTDFGVHPFWITSGIDHYIAASDFTKRQIAGYGVAAEQISVCGIPIPEKFLKAQDKKNLLKKFSLDAQRFTLLIFTGSFGIGPLEELVEILHPEIQLIVVCARNRRLYRRLKSRALPNVKVFAFVDNIEELMAISDLIVTKPGGLSIAESLSMDLFPIFISPIPGQETENIRILAEYGVGIYLKNVREIADTVLDLKEYPERLRQLKENIAKVKKPLATRELYHALCQSSTGNTG